jgi:hypothetical protein
MKSNSFKANIGMVCALALVSAAAVLVSCDNGGGGGYTLTYSEDGTTVTGYTGTIAGHVTIPEGVTSIGSGAFSDCRSLTSVTIPASVTSIGYGAFYYCTGLTSVTFAASNIANNFGDYAFPEGSYGYGGGALKTAYSSGGAGTYTRVRGGSTWTKQ